MNSLWPALFAAVGLVVGALATGYTSWIVQRRLASRAERRDTYAAWLKGVATIPETVMDLTRTADVDAPRTEQAFARVGEMVMLLTLDGSKAVREKLNSSWVPAFESYWAEWQSLEGQPDGAHERAKTLHERHILPVARSVARLMAKDLHGWRRGA